MSELLKASPLKLVLSDSRLTPHSQIPIAEWAILVFFFKFWLKWCFVSNIQRSGFLSFRMIFGGVIPEVLHEIVLFSFFVQKMKEREYLV